MKLRKLMTKLIIPSWAAATLFLLVGCNLPFSFLFDLQCAFQEELEFPAVEFERDPDDPCLFTTTADLGAIRPDFQASLAEARCRARSAAGANGCRQIPAAFEVGTTSDGSVLYINVASIFSDSTDFFDAETGKFIAGRGTIDAVPPEDPCQDGVTFSGRRVDFSDRVVLENLCP